MTDLAKPAAAQAVTSIRRDPTRKNLLWMMCQGFFQFIATAFFKLKVYGIYNLPRTGGALIVSNHQSYLDPILLTVRLDRPLSYLAKSELFKNRIFGASIRLLNAFPVEQGAGDIGAVKESIARLQEGHVLNIFPEGSRTEDGEIGPIEKGVALVIRRAKVPVVPVVIDGSFQSWPKSRKFPRPYPTRVVIGPPIDGLWKLDRDEIVAEIDRTLRQMLTDLRANRIPPSPRRPVGR